MGGTVATLVDLSSVLRMPSSAASRLRRTLVVALLLGTSAVHAADAPRDRVARTVDAAIRPLMAREGIPGMAVGLVIGDTVRAFTYGVASKETGRPVTRDTLFELGSVSKTFTATLASEAAVRGVFSLDDPVRRCLPDYDGTPFGDVRLVDLGTHTAGGFPLQFPDAVEEAGEDGLRPWLRDWKPSAPAGTRRTYANPSIGMLGRATAACLGEDFTVLMERRLLPALGMRNTFIRIPAERAGDYALGTTREGESIRMGMGLLGPEAYGLKSTVDDLLRFEQANMGLVPLDPVLQRAVTATHTGYVQAGPMTQDLIWEQYPLPVTRRALLAGNARAMILSATPVTRIVPPTAPRDDVWINKTGSTNGFATYLAYIPAKRLGIVLLANRNYPIDRRVEVAYRILTALSASS